MKTKPVSEKSPATPSASPAQAGTPATGMQAVSEKSPATPSASPAQAGTPAAGTPPRTEKDDLVAPAKLGLRAGIIKTKPTGQAPPPAGPQSRSASPVRDHRLVVVNPHLSWEEMEIELTMRCRTLTHDRFETFSFADRDVDFNGDGALANWTASLPAKIAVVAQCQASPPWPLHDQRILRVRGKRIKVDEEIRGLIALLNGIPGLKTIHSCQGGNHAGDGYVCFEGKGAIQFMPHLAHAFYQDRVTFKGLGNYFYGNLLVKLEFGYHGIFLRWNPKDYRHVLELVLAARETFLHGNGTNFVLERA